MVFRVFGVLCVVVGSRGWFWLVVGGSGWFLVVLGGSESSESSGGGGGGGGGADMSVRRVCLSIRADDACN